MVFLFLFLFIYVYMPENEYSLNCSLLLFCITFYMFYRKQTRYLLCEIIDSSAYDSVRKHSCILYTERKKVGKNTVNLTIIDRNNKEAIVMLSCILISLEVFAVTDIDGKARFGQVSAGNYMLIILPYMV